MRTVHELDETHVVQLHALFRREWWTADRSLEETRRCVEGSQICIGLTDDTGNLILAHPDLARVRHFELYCRPDVGPFYERHGFSTEVGGVRLMRRDGA